MCLVGRNPLTAKTAKWDSVQEGNTYFSIENRRLKSAFLLFSTWRNDMKREYDKNLYKSGGSYAVNIPAWWVNGEREVHLTVEPERITITRKEESK